MALLVELRFFDPEGVAARGALRGQEVTAPDLLDVEVLAILRARW